MTTKIYEASDALQEWRSVTNLQDSALFKTKHELHTFNVALDWLRETSDCLIAHRRKGFDIDPWIGQLEYMGVMQCIFVQQDSITTIWKALGHRTQFCAREDSTWNILRNLRNFEAGHPTDKRSDQGSFYLSTTTPGQHSYGTMTRLIYENGKRTQSSFQLGTLIDQYDLEAAEELTSLRDALRGSP